MFKKTKNHIAYYLGRHFPITISHGLSKGMKLYGDIFYNRTNRPLDHGDLFFQSLNLEGAHVFEVGSNLGQYTVYFSKAVASGKVYSIEPNPINYETLCKTLLANACNNVIPINKGISNVDSELLFMSSLYNRATGTFNTEQQGRLITKYQNSNLMRKKISVTTLAQVFIDYKAQKADLIKIDTEGYELQVIEGITSLLKIFKPVIIFETHGSELSKQNDLKKITDVLFDAGYRVMTLSFGLIEIVKATVGNYGSGSYIAFSEEKIGVTDAMHAVKRIAFGS